MKIYGYYVDVPQLQPENELKLTFLWRERWSAAGFEPIILNEWQARQHPLFDRLDAAVSALPSTNPQPYERACFLRWLALAQVGGGFMSDFDVIPYPPPKEGIGPNDRYASTIHSLITAAGESGGRTFEDFLHMFQGCAPSLVFSTEAIAVKLCQRFIDGQPEIGRRNMDGRVHYSDQYAIEDITEDWIKRHDLVKGFMDEGWFSAPAVHYSNSVMTPSGKQPRHVHIPLLRA